MAAKKLGKLDKNGEGCKASGPHVWHCGNCDTVYRDMHDDQPCPGCGRMDYQTAIPSPARVTGSTYKPYHGHGEWGGAANNVLAHRANDNFRNGRR